MRRRKDRIRPEIAAEAEQSRQAREDAEADLERARAKHVDDLSLADWLRSLNASNGFAEALVREVVRGAG